MIEVRYKGQLGNNLYQYCLGRALAERMGFALVASPIVGFPQTFVPVDGDRGDHRRGVEIYDGMALPLDRIEADRTVRKIVLEGYFQRYEYYEPFKDKIRQNWLHLEVDLDDVAVPGPDDVVVHVRRRDHIVANRGLPFAFYDDVLDGLERLGDVCVVSDAPEDEEVRTFVGRRGARVFHSTTQRDLKFVTLFRRIVMSRSTFSWWGAYLSDAEEVYFPVPSEGLWSRSSPEERSTELDLTVDESRFRYVDVAV